ncbi:MAG: GNAT family N-acetyltransferase [Pseudomonadota bacterium]
MDFRPAQNEDCDVLTALCLRSKAVHGYDAEFMAACAAELAVTPEKLALGGHLVVSVEGHLMGYAQVTEDKGEMWLEALFVDPGKMGKGIGKALFQRVMTLAQKAGAQSVLIDSDPGAEAFYLSRGAVRIGEAPSGSIAGRVLPRLRYAL